MKKNKILYLFSGLITIIIISITIGYSAFGTQMNISGISTKVRLEDNIRVTALSVESTTENASSSYEDYNIAALLTEVTLPTANSQITYKVTITNFGNREMGIFSLENLPENLEYELSNYNLQEKICDTTNKCTLGAQKTFYLTIRYKANGYNGNTVYPLNLKLTYKPFYTITYINIDGTNYPKEIMENTKLQLTFQEPFPKYLTAYNEANVTVPFTYENGVLTIENITENLTIENQIQTEDKDFIIENNSETETWQKIPEGSSITIDDLLNATMTGINISDKKIIQMDVTIEYQSSTGSEQSVNVLLDTTTNSYSQGIVFTKQEKSTTVSFSGLSLGPKDEFSIQVEQNKLTNHNIQINKINVKVYFEE